MEAARPCPEGRAPGSGGVTSTDSAPARHTRRELFLLAFTEAWERFSYYGVRGLLVLFLTASAASGGMEWSAESSLRLLGWFAAFVYILPVVGGLVGDRVIGPRRAVRTGAAVLIVAYSLLAASAWLQQVLAGSGCGGAGAGPGIFCALASIIPGGNTQSLMLASLALIGLGAGLFKPNITVLVGALYKDDEPARESGFLVFYLFMNLGVVLCGFVIGTLGERVAWHFGFLAAAVAMVLSMFIFSASRSGAARQAQPAPRSTAARERRPLGGGERAGIGAIAILGIFATLFWIGLDQTAGLLNLFAFESTEREVFGVEIPATWFQSLNPLFIIVLAPAFAVLWRLLAARGSDPRTEWKFVLGLLAMASAFAVMSIAGDASADGSLASPAWLVAAYFLLTIGELCIWTISLAAVTRLSPERHAGLIVGLWYLAIALGSWCAGQIGALVGQMPVADVFALLSKLFVVGAILLAAAAPLTGRLQRRAVTAST